MLNENRINLSKYRLEKAQEFLKSAVNNLKSEDYMTANNRAYYCVFHSMRAVIALDGVDFKKHSGVIAYFREHYIKTGIFDKMYSDIISSTSLIRSKSDYDDFYIAQKDETIEQVKNAEEIYNAVEEYLHTLY